MTSEITFIGDVHGKIDQYLQIIQPLTASVQVGDMGIGFNHVKLQYDNPDKPLMVLDHKFIHGNHDNPDACKKHPAFLGRFGVTTLNNISFFFVSGGYSIDKDKRMLGVDWWDNEELNFSEATQCLNMYNEQKPDIVVSHDCPRSVQRLLFPHYYMESSSTKQLLEALLNTHRPKLWVFGHHHVSKTIDIGCSKFVCLNELETFTHKE